LVNVNVKSIDILGLGGGVDCDMVEAA
jgi:hypothetical protein